MCHRPCSLSASFALAAAFWPRLLGGGRPVSVSRARLAGAASFFGAAFLALGAAGLLASASGRLRPRSPPAHQPTWQQSWRRLRPNRRPGRSAAGPLLTHRPCDGNRAAALLEDDLRRPSTSRPRPGPCRRRPDCRLRPRADIAQRNGVTGLAGSFDCDLVPAATRYCLPPVRTTANTVLFSVQPSRPTPPPDEFRRTPTHRDPPDGRLRKDGGR